MFLKIIALLALALPAHALLPESDRALIVPRNLLKNPGAENGKAYWTASAGTFILNGTAANIASGNSSFSWDASATGQTLKSTLTAIPNSALTRQSKASCKFKCASGTCTHTLAVSDGTNLLSAEKTITSSTGGFIEVPLFFRGGASGSWQMQITAKTNEPIVYVDDCYLGEGEDQPDTYGEVYVYDHNGFGSTNTTVVQYLNTATYTGTSMTYNAGNKAVFGTQVIINDDGYYFAAVSEDDNGTNGTIGIVVDPVGTTAWYNQTQSKIVCGSMSSVADRENGCSGMVFLRKGQIISPVGEAGDTPGTHTWAQYFRVVGPIK